MSIMEVMKVNTMCLKNCGVFTSETRALSSGRLEGMEIRCGGGSLSRAVAAVQKDACWGGRGVRFDPKEFLVHMVLKSEELTGCRVFEYTVMIVCISLRLCITLRSLISMNPGIYFPTEVTGCEHRDLVLPELSLVLRFFPWEVPHLAQSAVLACFRIVAIFPF